MNMPLTISIYVSNSALLPTRPVILEKLFLISKEWLSQPVTVTLWDLSSGEENNVSWDESTTILSGPLSSAQFLIIRIPDPSEGLDNEIVTAIGINSRKNPYIVYNISLTKITLDTISIEVLEKWIIKLYELFSIYSQCILIVGDERALISDRNLEEAMAFAINKKVNAQWIIAPENLVSRFATYLDDYIISSCNNGMIIRKRS